LSIETMRRTCTFSPTLEISAARVSSTVWPSSAAALRASTLSTPSAAVATASQNARKFSSLATKSVSELISTSAARLPCWARATRPSAATRSAFLSALARPDLRSASAAASMLPPASVSAFLHSIMPAPVRSRSSLTREAVISIGDLESVGFQSARPRMVARPRVRRVMPGALLGGFGLALGCLGLGLYGLGLGFGGLGLGGCGLRLRGFGLLAGRGAARLLAFAAFAELFLAHGRGARRGGLALEHGVGRGAGVQLHGADGVVVAGDGVVDQVGVVVGVDDRDHRDAELLGFLDGDVFMADVDHEQGVGEAVHFLDAAQRSLELVALAAQAQHFVLDQLFEAAVGLAGFQRLQARDRALHGAEVGQRAAQPALGHVR